MSKRKTVDLAKHQNPVDDNGKLMPERTACAPYNFVPLPERVVLAVEDAGDLPDHDTFANEGHPHTGYFKVNLITKSPTYVRCAMTREQFDNQESDKYADGEPLPNNGNPKFRRLVRNLPDFFYTQKDKKPVIPGSSLRGMLRSLLEIISYSKVQAVSDNQVFYRAVGDRTWLGKGYQKVMQTMIRNGYCPKAKAGYLSKSGDSYFITSAEETPAQYFRVEEQVAKASISGLVDMRKLGTRSGRTPYYEPNSSYEWIYTDVWFQPVAPQAHNHKGCTMFYGKVVSLQENQPASIGAVWKQGVFIASGWMPAPYPRLGKHLHWIVNRKSAKTSIRISDEDILAYRDGGGITDRIRERKFSVLPQDGKERACFYIEWKDYQGKAHVTLGHTPFFRLPYEGTPIDHVPEEFRKPEDIDFGEAIFGYTKKQGIRKERAYAGRVFVTDAKLEPNDQENLFLSEPFSPKILAAPKPTCFQHYLVQKEPYEIQVGTRRDGSPIRELRLRNYNHMILGETAIRGHKLYWHQGDRNVSHIKEDNQEWIENGDVKEESTQHTRFKPVRSEVTFTFDIHFENISHEELGALCLGALSARG